VELADDFVSQYNLEEFRDLAFSATSGHQRKLKTVHSSFQVVIGDQYVMLSEKSFVFFRDAFHLMRYACLRNNDDEKETLLDAAKGLFEKVFYNYHYGKEKDELKKLVFENYRKCHEIYPFLN